MRIEVKIILIIFLSIVCPEKSVHLFAQEDWTLRREKDGITIYTRTPEDNPIKEYRFRATINAPLSVVFEFLNDLSLHPQWVYQCSGLTIIEELPGSYAIYHTSYDIPWPASDRDLVAKALVLWEEDSMTVRILTEEISLDYDLVKGVVRMPDYKEDAVLKQIDEASTLFITEGFADPGGSIPPWLINIFLVDGIYDSVTKIREWTEKE